MKKLSIILLIAFVASGCVFAGRGIFDLTVGAAAGSTYSVNDFADWDFEHLEFSQFQFGGDVEMRLAFLTVDGKAMFAPGIQAVSGLVTANLAVDIFFVRVKAGLGYHYQYDFANNRLNLGNVKNAKPVTEFKNLKDANFDVNVGVDVLLGNFTLGVFATLPTETSVSNGNWDSLFSSLAENWKAAQLGLTIGYALL